MHYSYYFQKTFDVLELDKVFTNLAVFLEAKYDWHKKMCEYVQQKQQEQFSVS